LFLRENVYASCVLLVLRLYLGWSWLQAGWGKIVGGNFDATGFLKGALEKVSGDHPAVQPWGQTLLVVLHYLMSGFLIHLFLEENF
jgi:uncharacterized membrane protein YphA (DoxX/SURF4 family)